MQQHLGHEGQRVSQTPKRPAKVVRTISAVVTLAAVGTLGLLAAKSGGTQTRHTTVTHHEAARAPAPKLATPATVDPSASAASEAPTPAPAPPPLLAAPSVAVPPQITPSPVVTSPTTTPTLPATPPVSSPSPAAVTLPACPLPLPAPASSGGLQSLIALAPVFGPFSAEAFASAATFQPLLELLGPFLVAFAQHYAAVQPTVTPLLTQLESFENQGYAVLAPFYGRYRAQFLSAETALATALAPVASTMVDNSAASCVVDIEGVLTAAA